MTSKKIIEFPDVSNKLQAPSKKSLFERQKADAEAKRLREEAETKAVYDDFVKSFDDEDDAPAAGTDGMGGMGGMGGNRHFGRGGFSSGMGRGGFAPRGGPGMGSGPGSLGPLPGNMSSNALPKKRTFEGFAQSSSRRDDRGPFAFDDYSHDGPASKALKTFDHDEDSMGTSRDEERAVAKPTLRLASLPPGTSPAVIKALLPTNLTVDAVRIIPPSGPTSFTERKSMSAIVTLAKDTPANDIDTTVNSLQNKYLGFGYYLNLHRHLSSAAISNSTQISNIGSAAASQPFGAKPVNPPAARGGFSGMSHRGGFAPPTSYNNTPQLSRSTLFVPVQPPQDIKELKLIHKTIESLLTHGPEFEALLMSRASVQREEKWAWLWDSRSTGGVWYRWRLWEVLTGSQSKRGQGKYLPLFEGSSAWKQPDQPLAYEYTTRLDEFVSDSEYNSSDEDDSGDEGARRPPIDPNTLNEDGKAYLNPLEKAKLTHLLSRLPTSTGKLRKGDVARVTAFAISHAGRGADEVVSAIVSNVEKPFAYTSANPDRKKDKERDNSGDEKGDNAEEEDTSSASLIGLYIVSDILSSSSTSGVRHAWRYRQLFEQEMRRKKTFEGLGRMERKMKWGRLRAEKWKRSVGNVLGLWEGWCVFPQESQDEFGKVFREPPLSAEELKELEEKGKEEKNKEKSKWKAVEVAPEEKVKEETDEGDLDGEPMVEDDEDVDGVPMEEEDVDGEPMADSDDGGDLDGEPMQVQEDEVETYEPPPAVETAPDPTVKVEESAPPRRARPRAVDMFADSDDED
ncbi:similar to coatamer subunit protein [Botrytis cinerea T4]|uniref:Similar to coatamer subunit protein n=1 Tax=Botryotinia fuckeliana (strain T4) TaxID=999810 RepID=G2YKP0_BOTF4|nr:similar to coatamer subunit protein [Botrytis cinerea T4]